MRGRSSICDNLEKVTGWQSTQGWDTGGWRPWRVGGKKDITCDSHLCAKTHKTQLPKTLHISLALCVCARGFRNTAFSGSILFAHIVDFLRLIWFYSLVLFYSMLSHTLIQKRFLLDLFRWLTCPNCFLVCKTHFFYLLVYYFSFVFPK